MHESSEVESTQTVTSEYVESETWGWHSEGTNDYKNHYFRIEKVVDGNGVEYVPVWQDEQTTLCAGVETLIREQRHYLRIHRSACPLRVRYSEYVEYVSYDSWEHSSSWTRREWVRYVAEELSGKGGDCDRRQE